MVRNDGDDGWRYGITPMNIGCSLDYHLVSEVETGVIIVLVIYCRDRGFSFTQGRGYGRDRDSGHGLGRGPGCSSGRKWWRSWLKS